MKAILEVMSKKQFRGRRCILQILKTWQVKNYTACTSSQKFGNILEIIRRKKTIFGGRYIKKSGSFEMGLKLLDQESALSTATFARTE